MACVPSLKFYSSRLTCHPGSSSSDARTEQKTSEKMVNFVLFGYTLPPSPNCRPHKILATKTLLPSPRLVLMTHTSILQPTGIGPYTTKHLEFECDLLLV